MNALAFELKRVCKSYRHFQICDLDLELPTGCIMGLIGPNGAGKSTTLKLLTGFLAPSQGIARIAGVDVHTDRLKVASNLGYLPENGPLYPDMTPLETLRFFGSARGLDSRELKKQIERVTVECALEQVIEKPIGKLSRGYKQRVGLAQALLHEPDVLLLDEATSALDNVSERAIQRNLERAVDGRTTLIIAHRMSTVRHADRILVMDKGRIVEEY